MLLTTAVTSLCRGDTPGSGVQEQQQLMEAGLVKENNLQK